jgi:alpha-L-arabinofuranosidase
MLLNNEAATGQDGLYASAVMDQKTKELILKIVNTSDKPQNSEFLIDGVKSVQGKGLHTELRSDNLETVNSFENPTAVSPVQKPVQVKNKKVNLTLKPYSFNVIRVKVS